MGNEGAYKNSRLRGVMEGWLQDSLPKAGPAHAGLTSGESAGAHKGLWRGRCVYVQAPSVCTEQKGRAVGRRSAQRPLQRTSMQPRLRAQRSGRCCSAPAAVRAQRSGRRSALLCGVRLSASSCAYAWRMWPGSSAPRWPWRAAMMRAGGGGGGVSRTFFPDFP